MAIWPWAQNWKGQEQAIDTKPHFARWLDAMAARPAVVAGKAVAAEMRSNATASKESQKILFGQKG
jgi:GST-like protein